MPLPYRELSTKAMLRAYGSEFLPATGAEALGAVVTDPTLFPTALGVEALQQGALEREFEPPAEVPTMFGFVPEIDVAEPVPQPLGKPVERLDQAQVDEEFPGMGVKVDRPTPRPVVELIAKRRKADIIRQDTLARGPQGLATKAVQFGAALAASATDPLNVASAFIPAVGPTRYAAWATRMGRTQARLATGAIEGTVGALAVEPVVFGLSNQLQLDYDMSDALLNVALGGFLGAGLHVAGGAVADRLRRLRTGTSLDNLAGRARVQNEVTVGAAPATMEAALKTSVAQAAQGAEVNVRPHFEVERTVRERREAAEARPREAAPPEAVDPEVEELVGQWSTLKEEQQRLRTTAKARPSLAEFAAGRGGAQDPDGSLLAALGGENPRVQGARGRPRLIRAQGQSLDDLAQAAFEAGYFPERPTAEDMRAALAEDVTGQGVPHPDDAASRETLRAFDDQMGELRELGLTFRHSEAQVREIAAEALAARRASQSAPRPRRDDLAAAAAQHAEAIRGMAEPAEPHDQRRLREAADVAEADVVDDFGLEQAQKLDEDLDARLRDAGIIPEEAPPAREPAAEARPPEAPALIGPMPERMPAHRVTAADGTQVEVAPVVVEASQVLTSADPGYDPALQPRQRERAASEAQIREIATRLDPERLGFSTEADRGAPIIGPDGMVESGNGRVLALRRVYEQGGETAERYRDWLASQGVDVTGFEQPVLVRQRITDMTPDERRAFTVAANQAATLAMSASERALADARLITPEALDLIRNPDDLGAVANRDFVRAVIAKLPQAEQGAMITAEGGLSAEGLLRIRNAVLARAYGDAHVLTRVAEATDDDVKSISNALVAAAPNWAKLRADIDAGAVRPDMDMTPDLIEAVGRTADLRGRGTKLEAFLAQQDAFDQLRTEVETFMRLFYDPSGKRAAAANKIADGLRFYAEEARKATTDQGLDLGLVPVEARDVQRLMLEKVRGLYGGARPEGDLFLRAGAGDEPGAAAGGREAQRPGTQEGGPGPRGEGQPGGEGREGLPRPDELKPRLRGAEEVAQPADVQIALDIINRLPKDIQFKILEGRQVGDFALEGGFDKRRNLLFLTRAALDPIRTLRHEELHALRALGLFTEQEWATLVRHADAQGLRQQYRIDDDYGAFYRDRYADPAQFEEALQEETVARMVERYDAGERFGGTIDRILQAISEFLTRLGNAMRGMGFQTVDDVIARIESGEVGRREPARQQEGGARRPSLRRQNAAEALRDFREEIDIGFSDELDAGGFPPEVARLLDSLEQWSDEIEAGELLPGDVADRLTELYDRLDLQSRFDEDGNLRPEDKADVLREIAATEIRPPQPYPDDTDLDAGLFALGGQFGDSFERLPQEMRSFDRIRRRLAQLIDKGGRLQSEQIGKLLTEAEGARRYLDTPEAETAVAKAVGDENVAGALDDLRSELDGLSVTAAIFRDALAQRDADIAPSLRRVTGADEQQPEVRMAPEMLAALQEAERRPEPRLASADIFVENAESFGPAIERAGLCMSRRAE